MRRGAAIGRAKLLCPISQSGDWDSIPSDARLLVEASLAPRAALTTSFLDFMLAEDRTL